MTKVCLIDGSGYIFRAFYALPMMNAADGTPVNAVYGFVTMFMRLLKNVSCDYCLVLFDAKRENFRNEFFPEYKTNRSETPELLIPQFELIHEAVKVMGLPYVEQNGYEADDLIATYAKKSLEKGYEVVIVSADKDLMQLIRDGVSFYDGMKDKYFTPEDVKEKFGVYPDKVAEVQALSGDKIDNVPGVPGIGPKTAAELINEYGSLQKVLESAVNMKPSKRRDLLIEHRNDAEVSLKLVTLKEDVPLEHNLDELNCQIPDKQTLLSFIDRLGFQSIRPKILQWVEERSADKIAKNENIPEEQLTEVYEKISTREELEKIYKEIKNTGQLSFQVLFDAQKIAGFSLSPKKGKGYYLPMPSEQISGDLFSFDSTKNLEKQTVQKFWTAVAEDKDILKITAGLKQQWHYLNQLCGKFLDLSPFEDLSIMSYDLDSSEHNHDISSLSGLFLNKELAFPKLSGKHTAIDFETAEYGNYVYAVSDYIARLYPLLKQRIFTEKKTYVYEILDRKLVPVLLKMEESGIVINEQKLQDMNEDFQQQLQKIEREIYALAGEEFNLNSPNQIGDILFKKMGLKGKKLASGHYNTGAEVLEMLAEEHEIAAKILEWRMYSKLKSTYTTALLEARDKNSRVHTTFSQTVVNTGRLASSNPNLQNIPNRTDIGRKIRGCFEAKPGYKLVAADYSQMELRLMAAVADVKALKEAFAENVDIHAATAARVFNIPYNEVDREHRSRAKAINFGIIYGISQFGLARQIGTSRELAKQYIDSYFAIMPEVKEYMEETIKFAHANGFVLTPFGRKCSVAGINDSNRRYVSFAERAAINAPIQGGAADIVKIAMQRVDRAIKEQGFDAKLLLQVHDELVVEARAEQAERVAELLKSIMESVAGDKVKLLVETGIGDDWNGAH